MSTERTSAETDLSHPLIGVIGGSGLYELFEPGLGRSQAVDTPYGRPSAEVMLGEAYGRRVAFLPRHGPGHTIPPQRIPYRANIWALAALGAQAIVTSSAVGAIGNGLEPDTFVLPDQLIDRTRGRDDTFFDGDDVQHLPLSDPFCPRLREVAAAALTDRGERFAASGTTVVIQGPRFSTRAESRWFAAAGADIVNMTQYPEVALAAELNVGLVNLSYVTDIDAGESAADAVDPQVVLARMAEAAARIRAAIGAIVADIPSDYAPRHLLPAAAVSSVLAAAPLFEAPVEVF